MVDEVGPGGAGGVVGAEEGGVAEKIREVAGPVEAAMAALRAASEAFSRLNEHGLSAGDARGLRVMCDGALLNMRASLEEAFSRALEREKPKGPSPALLFRLGFAYGEAAKGWVLTPEDERPDGEGPPPNWEAAWAVVRSQLAMGGSPDER